MLVLRVALPASFGNQYVAPLVPQFAARYPAVAIYAVYPHRRHLPAKTRAFIDFLADSFGPEPYWDQPRAVKPRIKTKIAQ